MINIQIEEKECIFENQTFNETFDINILNKILLLDEDELKELIEKNYQTPEDDEKISYKKNLEKIKKLYRIKNKGISIKYKSKYKFGRYNPEKNISLGKLPRVLRHTICKNLYEDIDIQNCAPTTLYQICKSNNIKCDILEKYVLDRNKIFEELMNENNINRDTVKSLFHSLIFGGSIENFEKIYNIKIVNKKFLMDFKTDINNITNIILSNNPVFVNYIISMKIKERKIYHNGSILSYYLYEIENRILENIYKYLKKNNYIKNNNCILCNDGIMILKQFYNEKILTELNEHIKTTMNFNLVFTNKEMNEDFLYKIEEEEEDIQIDEKQLNKLNSDYFNNLPNYNLKKKYWEHFVCKILHPSAMFIIDEKSNNKIITKNMKDLIETYKHLKYSEYDKNLELVEKSFVNKWLDDKNIRHYDQCDFIPYNEKNFIPDVNIYNLFKGFNRNIYTSYDKQNKDILFEKYWKDICLNLCGNNIDYYNYFIKFISHMIQKPNERLGISFIIKGQQGTGKNLILNSILKIFNDENYIVSSNPEDIFGNHSEGFSKKIMVNLNECEGKDTMNYEGRIKSFITEETIQINPKGIRPYQIQNFSRLIIFSNKINPIPIDVKSKDRRFVVFKTTEKYLDKKYDEKFWKAIFEKINHPEFTAYLFDYFNNLNIEKFDFKKNRPITEAYKEMCKLYIPNECLFFEDLIIKEKYIDMNYDKEERNINYDDEEKEIIPFYKNEMFNKEVRIQAFDIYKKYITYLKDNGLYQNEISIKKFYANVIDLKLPIINKLLNGNKMYKFVAKDLYKFLDRNNFILHNDDELFFLDDEEQIINVNEFDDLQFL